MGAGAENEAGSKDPENLGRSFDFLLGTLEGCPQAIIALDGKRRIVVCNKAAEALFGYRAAELMGQVFPAGFAPNLDEILSAALGVHQHREVTFVRRDGARLSIGVSVVSLRDSDGATSGFVITSESSPPTDEQTSSRLEQEARLRTILETVPDAIIVIDDRARIQLFSAAAERQFGYRAEEVIGRNVSTLMPSPYRDEHDGYIHRYQSTHEPRIIGIGREVFGQRKDGSIFPMYLSVGEGKLEGASLYVGIIHDITEQQATERRLRVLQDELLQVSRISGMGQMASSLAHELNQPLTAVSSLMQAARRMLEIGDPAAMGRARDAVDRAGQQVLRAGEIIRRLREFAARGDTEKVVMPVDVIVSEALALASISNKFGATKVQSRLVEDAMVVVDKVQIQQVILNLVRNGLEAMENTASPVLSISATTNDDMVEVAVADVGPGISDEIRERLFEPFITTKSQGMGVGLAICRTIIESHGGKLYAEDNPGGGTIFRFTLARAIEEAEDVSE